MKAIATSLPGVLLLEPRVFHDERGFFLEAFNALDFERATGISPVFVQDNHSQSRTGVLRGIHYQLGRPQGKLVRVVSGEVFDVAVDLRRGSPAFGRWAGFHLSASTPTMLWIPPGFGHGFLVLSGPADVLYKTTDYRIAENERCLLWNDPALGIDWPLAGRDPILSPRDRRGAPLASAECDP